MELLISVIYYITLLVFTIEQQCLMLNQSCLQSIGLSYYLPSYSRIRSRSGNWANVLFMTICVFNNAVTNSDYSLQRDLIKYMVNNGMGRT